MKWLHFILSHSIFIAFCATALTFQTSLLLSCTFSPYLYGFIFFATLFGYNFYWILSKLAFAGTQNFRGTIWKQTGFYLLLFSGAGLLFCLFQTSIPFHFIATATFLTTLYALPLWPLRALQFTRRAGGLKTILLAFTWTYVTVVLPLQKEYQQLNSTDLFVISRSFLFMLMLCILFDKRDKELDKIRGLHSLATDMPVLVLRILIFSIFGLLFGTNLLFSRYDITLAQCIGLQISTLGLLVVYFFSNKKQGYLFYYFFVDGMMLFSALATYIAGI